MMEVHWGYLLLAAMLIASVGVLAWGAALARRRRREERIAREHERDNQRQGCQQRRSDGQP
ncbi:hypothetical protein [Pseudomonas vranovensis]|uniref:hypothetical protein n=1 Tax=Pseudomonas vranovensis TaxID=321661 RepID=UPI003D963401